jgi:glycolate oxidase FAD binding subunit
MTPATKLEELLSPGQVSERDGRPILSPQTTEEISAIARHANQHNLAIEITGAGTKRGWGNPVAADLHLDTTQLTGVLSHSWHDLTATVAAGTPWATMQRALAQHNQQVALDPLWPETATVGGIIATNDSGSLRLKYGSLRDLIIGMTIVLADGTIAKSGGKVVKNVAGYDLHKLMTGAFGTLGIIAEVTFRLHPIPAHTRVWTISSPDAVPIGELMMKVLDSQLTPQAMQIRASSAGFALDVELATLPEVAIRQTEALEQLSQSVKVPKVFEDRSALTRNRPFEARQELMNSADDFVIKATMQPISIARLSMDVVRRGGVAVTQATGIMLARFSESIAAQTLPGFYVYVDHEKHGSLTVLESYIHPLPEWAIPPSPADDTLPLMREIKHRFDPNRTLNPGRFIGGI